MQGLLGAKTRAVLTPLTKCAVASFAAIKGGWVGKKISWFKASIPSLRMFIKHRLGTEEDKNAVIK